MTLDWLGPGTRRGSPTSDAHRLPVGVVAARMLPCIQSPDDGIVVIDMEADRDAAEMTLLNSLREQRASLVALFSRQSDHWGFEDPIYRFYHQSWKVFALQSQTAAIVLILRGLVPERPLNPWFMDIVTRGTGRTFQTGDNQRWLEVTAPIVQAFFHARYFLEMAVRYSELDRPPRPLPSGYAALLCLYGLR